MKELQRAYGERPGLRFQKAVDFMKAAHRSIGQTRKDGKRPYEIHPLEVALRVAAVVNDEDVLIAALFHDILEDVTPLNGETYNESSIEVSFGKRVLKLVQELTDVYVKDAFPHLNRKQRKQSERERYALMSREAKWVKLSDIATNLLDDGGEFGDSFGGPDIGFNQMYIREKVLCLPFLRDEFDPINKELFEVASLALERQKAKFHVR